MEGKRGIRIVTFLYYIQEKGWEGGGNLEEVTVTMFDGLKPEATKRETTLLRRKSLS